MNARRSYQRIWKQDRALLGDKGMAAPRIRMVGKGGGYTTTGAQGDQWGAPRVINIGPGARRQLKSGNPAARYAIEHEFGRYFGSDAALGAPDGNTGAGVANAVANRLAHFRNTGKGSPKPYLRKKLPHFGQDPRSILFPPSP